jgi:hypothetical protein
MRRRRVLIWVGAGVVVVVAAVVGVVVSTSGGDGTSVHEVIPPGVSSGNPIAQPQPTRASNTTGIAGVSAYVTTGWPESSNNGPASEALGHAHVPGPVVYAVNPPVGGDHNAEWMNCGVYSQPVPNERAVHNLEHGAVWITYQPTISSSVLARLRTFQAHQTVIGATGSRYVDLTPYPGQSSPIMITSWGYQLAVTSTSDPRLQQFVNTFRDSKTYTPEYGGECTGGLGTPLAT